MGLLIQTSFETPEGITVTNVYSRLTGLTCDFLSQTEMRVLVKHETYITREKRLAGAATLRVPNLPEYFIFLVSPSESTWGSMENLYTRVKADIELRGFTVENVNPDPDPEPAPAEETTPA
jgi:hypothetical protein